MTDRQFEIRFMVGAAVLFIWFAGMMFAAVYQNDRSWRQFCVEHPESNRRECEGRR